VSRELQPLLVLIAGARRQTLIAEQASRQFLEPSPLAGSQSSARRSPVETTPAPPSQDTSPAAPENNEAAGVVESRAHSCGTGAKEPLEQITGPFFLPARKRALLTGRGAYASQPGAVLGVQQVAGSTL